MKVLPSACYFNKKRYSDRIIHKIRSRFCARGDHQIEVVDLFDTFSQEIKCTTASIMLILSTILGLSTHQVNYTEDFVHATIDRNP